MSDAKKNERNEDDNELLIKSIAKKFTSTINDHTYGYREVKLQRVELINNDKLKQKYLKSETTSKEDMYETLVFHGTPKDSNIESISKHNFDISKLGITTGNDGWYGSGVYVTEHAGAALRYQYWNTSTPPNRMLVCQVKLGKIFTVPLNSCDYVGKGLSPGYDSHKGRDRWDLADQLCIFNCDNILPIAHVYYEC